MATLQLDDEIAAALQRQARTRGLSVEALLGVWIEERTAGPVTTADLVGEEAAREFDSVLDELFASDPSPPPANRSPASSRADIYSDHD